MSTITTGAEAVEWNLADLYDGPDDPRIESELEETHAAAQAFRERYRGKLGELTASDLNEAVVELERIESTSTRVETYARLRQAADSTDQARGALVQRVRERNTQIETELLFFDLEWSGSTTTSPSGSSPIPRSNTTRRCCARSAATSRISSPSPRRRSPPRRASRASSAWGRLFNELVSDLSVPFDGDDLSLDEALAKLPATTYRRSAAGSPKRSPRRSGPACARAATCSTRS